jgi:DNA-directed RNA polymerase specialized sigma24 family protein
MGTITKPAKTANDVATAFYNGEASFNDYYNCYYNRLIQHSIRCGGDHQLADRIVNDLFIKLTCEGSNYKYDPTKSHLSYLMTSVFRYTIMYKRRKKEILESSLMGEDGNAPMDYYANRQDVNTGTDIREVADDDKIKLAIGQLLLAEADEVVQAAIKDSALGEASYDDLRVRYNLNSNGAIKTRVHRFRTNLLKTYQGFINYIDWATGAFTNGLVCGFAYNEDTGKVTRTMKGKVVDGNLHGEYEEYYADGSIKVICRYHQGALTGKYKRYHANGNLAEEIKYKKGVKVYSHTYGKDGSLIRNEEYDNGMLAYYAIYEDGEVIMDSLA